MGVCVSGVSRPLWASWRCSCSRYNICTMNEFKMTDEQLGMLLFKSMHEPRRNQKLWIRDCGGRATADELDVQLALARASKKAIEESNRLSERRAQIVKEESSEYCSLVSSVLTEIKSIMKEKGINQGDLATLCSWSPVVVSNYFKGKKEPGARNLLRMIDVLGYKVKIEKNTEKLN